MAEVKAVAWMCDDGRPFKSEAEARRNSWTTAYPLYDQSAIDTLTAERDVSMAECERLRTLCRDMLPVFEAARPLVLNLERLRDATKGQG